MVDHTDGSASGSRIPSTIGTGTGNINAGSGTTMTGRGTGTSGSTTTGTTTGRGNTSQGNGSRRSGQTGRGRGRSRNNNSSQSTAHTDTTTVTTHPEFIKDSGDMGVLRYHCYDCGNATEAKTRYTETTERLFFITDRIKAKEMRVEYCNTKDMVADFFTKPLQGQLFYKLRAEILNLPVAS